MLDFATMSRCMGNQVFNQYFVQGRARRSSWIPSNFTSFNFIMHKSTVQCPHLLFISGNNIVNDFSLLTNYDCSNESENWT